MRNRKFWTCLMVASLLLIVLAGCQNHDSPDPGTSQPDQLITSSTGTTEAPDDITEAPDTEKAPDSTGSSENSDSPDVLPSDTEWLKGDWTTMIWEDNSAYGDPTTFVTEITYSFGKDGTGSINDRAWISRPGAEWEIAGKGYVETYFIYTLEGDTLTITHTGSEFGEYPEEEIETDVYTVIRNQDGSITWVPVEGGESRIYRQEWNII